MLNLAFQENSIKIVQTRLQIGLTVNILNTNQKTPSETFVVKRRNEKKDEAMATRRHR